MTLSVATSSRGYLSYEPGEAYLFGPLNAPLLTLNAPDEEGVLWWADVPEGWDAPAAVTPMDERAYGDGAYAGHTTYQERVLTFGTATAVAPDRAAARRAWRRVLTVASSRAGVLFSAPDFDGLASLWVRASGQPKVTWHDERSFTFSFVMVAEDPLKFSAAELTAADRTALLPVRPTGATWPLSWPIAWGVGGTDTALTIENRGDEDAQAVYLLTVPADSAGPPVDRPQVTVTNTGLWFTINRALFPGDTVEVDTAAATVYLNGVSIFGDLRGSFPPLPPGVNTVRWGTQGGARNPDATLTVRTASTWK